MLGHGLVFVGFVAFSILRVAGVIRGVRTKAGAELNILLEDFKIHVLSLLEGVSHNPLGGDGDSFIEEVSLLRAGFVGIHVFGDES